MFDRRHGGGSLSGHTAMMVSRWLAVAAVMMLPCAAVFAASDRPDPRTLMADPEQARADYVEHCGGCHGVTGDTVPARLPELAGRVGWFMCTPAARAYLIRLPNVAHSRITDNAQLADMMNYVVFVIGGSSAPVGTRPFTADEVARERPLALTNANLTAERDRLTRQLVRQCHAPASIRDLYIGAKP